MISLIEKSLNAKTSEEIQEVLNNLKFRIPKPYRLNSVTETLHLGEANCYEASLVAAHLMRSQGFVPRLLLLFSPPKNKVREGHAVYVYEKDGNFFSLGRSSNIDLEARLHPHKTIESLASSYAKGFNGMGLVLDSFAVVELKGNEWVASKKPITEYLVNLASTANYTKI